MCKQYSVTVLSPATHLLLHKHLEQQVRVDAVHACWLSDV
jgi:hypothetical protein